MTRRMFVTTGILGAFLGALVTVVIDQPEPTCTDDRITSLRGGLAYVEGYKAALVTLGANTARADADIEATTWHLTACGVTS